MSLDNLQLSPFLIQQFYQKTLVVVNSTLPTIQPKAETEIISLGNNEKKILIVVDEKDVVFLSDSDLNLLVSILTACKLSLADVAVVNFDKNSHVSYTDLTQKFLPTFILLFGIAPNKLNMPMDFPDFQLQPYNQHTFLLSPALKTIAIEQEQKKELWKNLQKYFFKK